MSFSRFLKWQGEQLWGSICFFFSKPSHSSSPYQTCVPLRSERESKLFLSSFSPSNVLYLKFCNLVYPEVLYNLLQSLFSISPKSSNDSVKPRPGDGTSINYIKGYGENLLFTTQHASACFLVTIPWVLLGNYQLPRSQRSGLDGIKPNPVSEWDFISLNRSVCPTPVTDYMLASNYMVA